MRKKSEMKLARPLLLQSIRDESEEVAVKICVATRWYNTSEGGCCYWVVEEEEEEAAEIKIN